jgi:hypothetical protein
METKSKAVEGLLDDPQTGIASDGRHIARRKPLDQVWICPRVGG